MKKFLGNTVAFVLLYVVFMIPTYILPYFGSNSAMMITAWSSGGVLLEVPQFLFHVACLIGLMVITWFRGSLIEKKWLLIFPILAAIFDFVPALNFIPLVPTVMHLLTIILGVAGAKAAVTVSD